MRLSLLALAFASVSFSDDSIFQRSDVKKALNYIEANHERTLASQVTIAEIPAPTFHEGERAKYMASEFRRFIRRVTPDSSVTLSGQQGYSLDRSLSGTRKLVETW